MAEWLARPGVRPHEPMPVLFRHPFAHYLCGLCEWPVDYQRLKDKQRRWLHLSTQGYPPEALRRSVLFRRVSARGIDRGESPSVQSAVTGGTEPPIE